MNALSTMSVYDIIVIAIYFVFIVYLGIKYGKSSDSEHYFLAGKNMTWPIIGFSMFAASISSSTLIGHGRLEPFVPTLHDGGSERVLRHNRNYFAGSLEAYLGLDPYAEIKKAWSRSGSGL